MLPGLFLDFYYNLSERFKRNVIFLALISGLSYMAIPFSRLFITITSGYQYGAFLKFGFFIPIISYMLFGLTGGLMGNGISNIFTRLLSKINQK